MDSKICIPVARDTDIYAARSTGRDLAERLGFSEATATAIATAVTELARNIVLYAGEGEVQLWVESTSDRTALVAQAQDHGPGIEDLRSAMQDGSSTGRRLGMGLPGCKRFMDEFQIDTAPGRGTVVTVKKVLPRNRRAEFNFMTRL